MNGKKRTRTRYAVLMGLVILLLGGWSVYWFITAHWLQGEVDEEIAGWRANGYDVQMQGRKMSGWPYRFALDLQDLQITAPASDGGWQLQQPHMVVNAMAWKLSHLIVEAGGTTILHPAQGEDLHLEHKSARASLVFDGPDLSRFSAEIDEPTLFTMKASRMETADRLELHVRPGVAADDRQVFLRLDRFQGRLSPFVKPVDVRGQWQVFAWNELVNRRNLSAFRNAGGKLDFNDVTLFADPARANISGSLHVDANGYAAGKLKVALDKPGDMMAALDRGQLDEDGRDALGLVEMLIGNVDRVALSFSFRNGRVYAGPFKLMNTDPLIVTETFSPAP